MKNDEKCSWEGSGGTEIKENGAKRLWDSPKWEPRAPQKGSKRKKREPGDPQERFWDPNVTLFGAFWGPNGRLFSEKEVKMEVKIDKY